MHPRTELSARAADPRVRGLRFVVEVRNSYGGYLRAWRNVVPLECFGACGFCVLWMEQLNVRRCGKAVPVFRVHAGCLFARPGGTPQVPKSSGGFNVRYDLF